jgi:hypothetical protein
MGAFFAGAVLVSALGGPVLVGLIVGGLAAWLVPTAFRAPPWTPGGRAAWRARGRSLATLARAGRAWWALARRARGGDPYATRPPVNGADAGWAVDPNDARDGARFDAAFAVRCEVVTERLQVWHSTDTGRAYEIDPRRAPTEARPGDLGWLAFEAGRPRVRLERDRSRVLN